MKFFTGMATQLGYRMQILADLLSSKEDPPRVWYNQLYVTTPRLHETLRFGVLEVQEHLETFFDRKDHVSEVIYKEISFNCFINFALTNLQCLEAMKSTYKLTLFSDTESAHEGSSHANIGSPDPATTELLIDLGRGLYKLLFQLLLLIESDHKIAISVMQNLRQDDRMEDLSHTFRIVRGALIHCIDDADIDSLDTSTSTEGENTPTPSPGPQLNAQEFENILVELIDAQKWSSVVSHVRQYRKYSSTATLSPTINYNLQTSASSTSCGPSSSLTIGSSGINWAVDDLSIILNVYAQRIIKDRNGNYLLSLN